MTIEKELPDFDFPLFVKLTAVLDWSLQNKLPLELFLKHEGYEFDIKGRKYKLGIQGWEYSYPIDTIVPTISTFIGRDSNAVHYYGNLMLPKFKFFDVQEKFWINKISGVESLQEVHLTRPLTEFEIKNNPERYGNKKPGDMDWGFAISSGIIYRAEEITKKHFPGFKLAEFLYIKN